MFGLVVELNAAGCGILAYRMSEHVRLAAVIRQTVNGLDVIPEEKPYSSLVLCIIDSVYSIGVRYESTERAVSNFCDWCRWDERPPGSEYCIRHFLMDVESFEGRWEALAVEVFRNRQRTSSRSGILKAEAVYRFAKALNQCEIDSIDDISDVAQMRSSKTAVELIPGQGSGISFKYFLMLAGNENLVKPDRMLLRFIKNALGAQRFVSEEGAQELITLAAKELREDFPHLTPARLDFLIWQFQREV